ncbi:hypothetical protein B5S30_g3013 [[Candida] boidinii]|nr:hypothetical protein B5S30_g3013 [[Candida] boidinii]
MSDILDQIAKDPTLIFKDDSQVNSGLILKQVKDIIDPLTAHYSVLDEIHIDGLVPSQVWGQVKLVSHAVGQDLLYGKIKEIKENLQEEGDDDEGHDDEGEDEEDDEDEDEEDEEQSELDSDSDEEYYNAVDDLDEISNSEEVEDVIGKDKFGLNDKFFSIDKFNKETANENNVNDEYSTLPPDINLLSDKLPEGESKDGASKPELYYTDYYKLQKGETVKDIKDQQIKNSEYELVPEKDVFKLNDQFFSIDEFNKQILKMESKGDNFAEDGDDEEEGEEIDYFNDLEDDDDDDEMLQYDDFFKPQVKPEDIKKLENRKPKDDDNDNFDEDDYDDAYESVMQDFADEDDFEVDEDEEIDQDEVDESTLSTFELQQLKIKREIEKLENEQISEKKWTMKGEVSAKNRKNDSLLVEELKFDRTAKPVPVITQEITETIVDIIRRRIKNEQFDELSKRIISELNNFKNSKKIEVSEEKSKKSLSELYEDEYKNALDGDNNSSVVNEELQRQHDEISELYIQLNHKLDSLCSSHFIPKPKEKLIDIKVQTSTISMEDAQPLTLSNAETLAPQEIYKTKSKIDKNEIQLKSGIIISKDELDRSEKQRLRRSKKRKIHNRLKENSEKKKKISTNNINK